jgi:hypothetical protein
MTAEVALRHVSIVLGLEVSRVARNNADWYRLLDLCGMTDTLIGDSDGLYHPALFNDRLLLGLKRLDARPLAHLGTHKRRDQRQHPYRRQKDADPSPNVDRFCPRTMAFLCQHAWYGGNDQNQKQRAYD